MSATFDPAAWAQRYLEVQRFRRGAATRGGRAMLHSELIGLHEELMDQLRGVPPHQADDTRPTLAAALTAVRLTEGGAA